MIKYILATVVIYIAVFTTAYAQDAVFSQHNAAPLQLNPALTGAFDGSYRFHANYRNQWSGILQSSSFQTMSAGMDYRIPVGRGDFAAIGGTALRDHAGDGKFSQTRAALSASFLKELSPRSFRTAAQFLSAGVQIGYGQNSLDWSRLWFSDQVGSDNRPVFSTATADPNAPTNDVGKIDFMDISAGLMYYAVIEERRSIYAGLALFHVNTPNVGLPQEADDPLQMRYLAHIGGELPLNDNLSLLPSAMGTAQGTAWQLQAGTSLRMMSPDWRDLGLRLGAFARINQRSTSLEETSIQAESIIISASLELERWLLGISYDLTTSSLMRANDGRGAVEISLIYTQPSRQPKSKVVCPNF